MRKKLFFLFFLCFVVIGISAQQKTITGTVMSGDDNEPILGATILLKGTSIGTSTDFDGKFTLSVPSDAKNLTFSYIGMVTVDVPITESMRVVLRSSEDRTLDELVVTGYQKIDRRLFTGSAEKISAEKSNISGVADVSQSMQGRVAGVNVKSVSGTFGAAPKLQVRGANTIYGNQTPLWVVDGVILEDVVQVTADQLSSGDPVTLISSAVAGLNADDIESFQILKDASASALYGARAMNGVIVVTTKKGKKGQVSVNYTGEFSIRMKPLYRDYNLMNSQDQMSVYKELENKGWLNYANVVSQANSGLYGYMYTLLKTKDENGNFLLRNDPVSRAKYLQSAEMINTDWFDVLFRNSITQNHAVSMSSGSERNRNYASLSLYNDPGWTLADKVNRFTGNFNSTTDITRTLSSTFSINGSIRKQQAPGSSDQSSNVVTGEISREFDINPYSYALNTSRTLDPKAYYRMNYAPFNEVFEMENNLTDITTIDLKLQLDLTWKPIKGLELSGLGAYRYAKNTIENKIYDFSNMSLAYRAAETSTIADANKFLYVDPDNPTSLPTSVLPEGGFYNLAEHAMANYYFRGMANYSATYDEKHLVNFLAGGEARSTDRQTATLVGYGYQWSQGGTPYTDYKIIKKTLEGGFDYYSFLEGLDRSAAGFATGSYSYMGKYTLNATARFDGTNQLGRDAKDRWLPTWNVSGSWNAKDEKFLTDNQTITRLTFRGTYGLTANPPVGRANALIILRNGSTFRPTTEEKESMIYISSLENSDLTWEKSNETNIGFDLGLWNKIGLTFDAYRRDNKDLIARVRTNGIGGQGYKWGNYASSETNGVEFSLGGRVFDNSIWSWDANLTFSYAKDKITDLKTNPTVLDMVQATGAPYLNHTYRGLYSFQFTGLTSEGFPKVINESGIETVGDINFQSTEGLDNLVYNGPIDAPYQGGFNNTLGYKNWKVNLFFTYQFGNVVRLNSSFKGVYTDLDVMPKEMKNRWTKPEDENYTNIPVIASKVQVSNNSNLSTAYVAYNYSTERVAKGDFIRLKEIFVTYDVPNDFSQKIGLRNIQAKLTASNIALIYSDKKLNGQDPEFVSSGGVAMPTPRQLTLTLKVGF